jgi:hypothetical protein
MTFSVIVARRKRSGRMESQIDPTLLLPDIEPALEVMLLGIVAERPVTDLQ